MKNYDKLIKQAENKQKDFLKELSQIHKLNDMHQVRRRIETSKIQAEAYMRTISILKQDLENDAKMHEALFFPKEHQEKQVKLNKMFDEYLDAQKRLFALAIKVATISHKTHK